MRYLPGEPGDNTEPVATSAELVNWEPVKPQQIVKADLPTEITVTHHHVYPEAQRPQVVYQPLPVPSYRPTNGLLEALGGLTIMVLCCLGVGLVLVSLINTMRPPQPTVIIQQPYAP